MYPIDPGDEYGVALTYGSQQLDDYEPLRARLHPEGKTVTRWRPTAAEREALINGGDVFLGILTFGNPLQPVSIWVETDE